MDIWDLLIFCVGLWIGSRIPKAWKQLQAGSIVIANKLNGVKNEPKST
jgi:hypothetical protein